MPSPPRPDAPVSRTSPVRRSPLPALSARSAHSAHSARHTRLITAIALATAITTACGGSSAAGGAQAQREVWGFTAFWDTASVSSVARNGAAVDALVTTWIALDTAGGLPQVLHMDSARAARVPAHRLALVTSYLHPEFRPVTIRRLAANPRMLARVAGSVAGTMTEGQHRGAVLDFEALTPNDLPALLAIIRTLADTLHARQLGPVVVAVPAADSIAFPGRAILEAGADFILPMLYDQHWAGGAAGPVAEPRWVEETLAARVREVGAARIIAALPLYGYRWTAPGEGVTVTFAEARRAGGAEITLERDSSTGSLRGQLPGGGQVWVTDATLLDDLLAIVQRHGVQRVALWYIGQEDPAVWQGVLSRWRGGGAPN